MFRVRTLSALAVMSLCFAACGAPGDGGPATVAATPQFVDPSSSAPAAESAPAAAPASVRPPAPSRRASASPASVSPSASASAPAKRRPQVTRSTPAATRAAVRYVFPVKASNVDYHPTHGKYPATDIFADCGEPVVATTSGVVLELSRTDRYVKGRPDGPDNGGLSVSLLGDDGVRYYGSHLSEVRSDIVPGVRVEAGQRLGDLGRTGNANNVCHLHYGISPPCARTGDWKVRRGVIWPAGYLDAWRRNENRSPAAKARAWQRSHNCTA